VSPTGPTVFDVPAPTATPSEVTALLRDRFGLDGVRLSPLPSERDQNLRVDVGDLSYVLKIANAAEDPAVADLEASALVHIAAVDPQLPTPRAVRGRDGELVVTAHLAAAEHLVRLVTVVPGRAAEGRLVTEDTAEQIGAACARTQLALRGFFHPAAGRTLDWDVRRLPDLTAEVPARVGAALDRLPALPAWIQHADLTLINVLTDQAGAVTGVVDVGDMHHTAAVCDLAVTLTSVVRNTAPEQRVGLWPLAAAVLRGYQRLRPLGLDEVDVLGELMVARLLVTQAVSARRAPVHAENHAYITQYDAANRRVLDQVTALDSEQLRGRFRRLCGLDAPGLPGAVRPDATATADTADRAHPVALPARRRAVQGGPRAGSVSPLFYTDPIEVVAGEGPWLLAQDGRRYLDGYNNVAVVGHSHPNVVQAVTRQAALLHTHSRYLHPNLVELAERLVASMPAGSGLDTCLFTTSGTEANELAWRLAVESTAARAGRPAGFPAGDVGAIVGSNAYHGSSRWLADLSSNEWPAGYRPAGVATFDGPVQEDAELTRDAALGRVGAAAEELRRTGRQPAMVIADSMFTSEGVRTVPPAFLAGMVDAAHEAGALYVADEVQVGFGRTGPKLWWFAELGITPDVVTLGKPMGAGYPIAAALTRRELVEPLAARYEFFSTFAGNPVGTAASLAVLDLLEDDALPARAVAVGGLLRAGIAALRDRSPDVVGEVRGHGLIAGVDLPSKPLATAVKEGLKARGVLVGTTGRHGNVLKVRPPLVWRTEHVALFLDACAGALDEVS